jgi:hypothetical protein
VTAKAASASAAQHDHVVDDGASGSGKYIIGRRSRSSVDIVPST